MVELIVCDNWQNLADHIYNGPEFVVPDKSCVVFCHMDNITRFFHEIENSPHKYVVISACSDYGVELQSNSPIFADMKKWLDFVEIGPELNYNPLLIPARCNNHLCKVTDKYSIKMHCFTHSTLSHIPNNIVKWYATNANIQHDILVNIPFGISKDTAKLIEDARTNKLHEIGEKKIGFYINFQNNTHERVSIKNAYAKSSEYFCVIPKEIPHAEFIDNLLKSVYVASPAGNGHDCYRTLESIYCGSIPIIPNNMCAKAYEGLPIIKVDRYDCLMNIKDELGFVIENKELENTRADMDYWHNLIEQDRSIL